MTAIPELIDITEVKDDDEILSIEFRCTCDKLRDTIPVDQILRPVDQILGPRMVGVLDNRCDRGTCLKHSGFQMPKGEKVLQRTQFLDRLVLRKHTDETRQEIQALLTGSNLKLRFKVQR
jgi:hypothetical protein